jgi:hypothetical protein
MYFSGGRRGWAMGGHDPTLISINFYTDLDI